MSAFARAFSRRDRKRNSSPTKVYLIHSPPSISPSIFPCNCNIPVDIHNQDTAMDGAMESSMRSRWHRRKRSRSRSRLRRWSSRGTVLSVVVVVRAKASKQAGNADGDVSICRTNPKTTPLNPSKPPLDPTISAASSRSTKMAPTKTKNERFPPFSNDYSDMA